ncbi:hypothetical protein MRB53_040838 [Persea americana]|nr:hypothetical protein MRB53_040838 [Persea americana]
MLHPRERSSIRTSSITTQVNDSRDKKYSEIMHGKDASKSVGFGAMTKKDKEAAELEAKKYFKFFERETETRQSERWKADSINIHRSRTHTTILLRISMNTDGDNHSTLRNTTKENHSTKLLHDTNIS